MSTPKKNCYSTSIKRIMKEINEFKKLDSNEIDAGPVTMKNVFLWHFTFRGPANSDFSDGIYHGSISLPDSYPFTPPDIIFLTPNGRFETNKKICLNVSKFHPESWHPSWSIRTVVTALSSFLVTEENGAIGSIKYPSCERKRLALLSQKWFCNKCNKTMSQILPLVECDDKTFSNKNLIKKSNTVVKRKNSKLTNNQNYIKRWFKLIVIFNIYYNLLSLKFNQVRRTILKDRKLILLALIVFLILVRRVFVNI